jgi:hypothetical protein
MSPDQQRNLELAIWHAQEAIVCGAANDAENVDFHTWAARDALKIAAPSAASRVENAYDIAGVCAVLMDEAGVIA